MSSPDLLVDRIEFENYNGQFWRQPAPKSGRRKGEKYYSGVSVAVDKSAHLARLYGTLSSGHAAEVTVQAKELHPNWIRVNRERAERFESEVNFLRDLKVPIIRNGTVKPDYEGLRKLLE